MNDIHIQRTFSKIHHLIDILEIDDDNLEAMTAADQIYEAIENYFNNRQVVKKILQDLCDHD